MTDDYDSKEDLGTLEGYVKSLKDSLPNSVDGFALSSISKIPFKAMEFREALFHRVAELSETALELYKKEDRLISAFLM